LTLARNGFGGLPQFLGQTCAAPTATEVGSRFDPMHGIVQTRTTYTFHGWNNRPPELRRTDGVPYRDYVASGQESLPTGFVQDPHDVPQLNAASNFWQSHVIGKYNDLPSLDGSSQAGSEWVFWNPFSWF